jgi:YegS/Rv2252/BmrU family lipid kinase
MHKEEALKFFFIINPISGGKEKGDWEASIRNYFKETPHQVETYLLTGNNDQHSIQHHMQTVKADRVIAVGGDGTVKMVAALLKESSTPLGILPAGSANGMAKELGIPTNVEQALDVIVKGTSKPIDIIRINEEHTCIHLSDVGLNAKLVKYFEQSDGRGMWGYGRAIFRVLKEKRKLRVTLEINGEKIKREAFMVALCNARMYGTGANIKTEGDVSDGKFEVVIVRKLNLLEIYKSIFTKKSFRPDKIEIFSTTAAQITLQRKAYFQIDGELMDKTSCIQARILPRVLNVMLP